MHHLVLTLLLGLVLVPALGSGSDLDRTVRLGRTAGGLLTAPVTLNGQGPFTFVVDTGASRTVVDPAVAHRLGLVVVPGARMRTSAGEIEAAVSAAGTFLVGGLQMSAVPVIVAPLEHLRASEGRLHGVIGQDVLGRVDVVIDGGARRLIVPAWGRPEGARVPFTRDATGRLRVMVRVSWLGETPVPLVVDSGATAVVLFAESPFVAGRRVGGAHGRLVRTAGHAVLASGLRPGRVEAGEGAWPDLPGVVMAGGATRADAGLLPLALLGPVYIDQARGELVRLDRPSP
ncbi:MAG: retropepsin-like aspartic protease [Vicinamibacterales bacterium]|nr:retropepsin-like aspartic protease [Vicinamibacterales bacterium]